VKKEKVLIVGIICSAIVSILVNLHIPGFNFENNILREISLFIGDYIYHFIIISAMVYIILQEKKHTKMKGIFLQSVIIVLALTTFHLVMKIIFKTELPRPSGINGGFPSGHTLITFALAFLCSVRNKKLVFPMFISAILISWSRIFAGISYPAHYPYQVVFGSILGIVFTYLMYVYLEKKRLLKFEKTDTKEV